MLEKLEQTYPEIAQEVKTNENPRTSLELCEEIASRLSPHQRESLITVLKEAIFQSTDIEKIEEMEERIRKRNSEKSLKK